MIVVTGGLILGLMYMFVLITPYFYLIETQWTTCSNENAGYALVMRIGRVNLKLTSGKTFRLKSIHYAPDIKWNMISGSLLVQEGFKVVFECNKVVISEGSYFIGKGFSVMISSS